MNILRLSGFMAERKNKTHGSNIFLTRNHKNKKHFANLTDMLRCTDHVLTIIGMAKPVFLQQLAAAGSDGQ